MQYHAILDYETIGQDVFEIPVVNCSYYVFDWHRFTSDNPYTFEELMENIKFDKFSVAEQMERGCKFKKRDLEWWQSNPLAKSQIVPSKNDISVGKFVDNIYNYLKQFKIFRWWSRSNTFDPILLHRNFRDYSTREKLDEVLPYWLVRDTRTYIDTQFSFKAKINGFCPMDDEKEWNAKFVAHDSRCDVAADILRMQRIERTINC